MLVKEYMINSPKSPGRTVIYGYKLNNQLYSVKYEGDFTFEQLKWLSTAPVTVDMLFAAVKKNGWNIKEVDFDLDFDTFWNMYGKKEGNKPQAQALWKKLPKAEKIKSIAFIEKYDNQLRMSGSAKCYPTSYLNQQRWNN